MSTQYIENIEHTHLKAENIEISTLFNLAGELRCVCYDLNIDYLEGY